MGAERNRHYIIMTNRPKDPGLAVTERIRAFLETHGGRVSVFADNEDTSRLGLTAEEEDVWIDDSDEALKEMLDAQKK